MKLVAKFSFLTKLSFILSLTVLTVLSQKSFSQQVITLQQAVDNTLKNNLTIKQAEFSTALSDETLRQSKYALYPTLNGSANYNMNFGRSIDPSTNQYISEKFSSASGSVSAGADLFRGFQKINAIRQNKLLLDADKTNVEKIKNDLILNVVTGYMQILYNKDLLAAAQEQLKVAQQTLNREQALLDAGNKTLADISQAKSQVATAELNVTNAQNNLSISYLTVNQLMEMPANTQFEVEAPQVDQAKINENYDINAIYTSALNTFPDIKLAALRTAAAAKDIDIAKGSYFPRLSIGGGFGSNYSSGFQEAFQKQIKDNFNQYVGLSLQIPIFNGFTARSNVRKAKINFQNSQVQESLAKNNLNKVISQAVLDLKAAESRYVSTQNAFNAQKDAYYAVEQRYNVGLVNSLDYSTAQTNRNKAEMDMIQAKYDLIFRAKVIDYYLGKQITF